MTTKTLCRLAVAGALGLGLHCRGFAAAPSVGADHRLDWWRAARFGLFIHWGPVSLEGTEIGWSRGGERRGYGSHGTEIPVEVYDNLYRQFNPTNFNAAEWVAIAQAAGAKYLVFTSRHHDGFSMFDTLASDYKITSPASPFRRDVVKELAEACHRAGLRFGVYYSPPDWHNPDAFTERHAQYQAYLKAQVRELMTHYGPVDILWYDGLGKSAADYDAVNLNRMVRQLQPQILINNRSGLPGDFDTPEQVIGKFQNDRPWESCITICHQWAWKPGDEMKSLPQCLDTLIRCAGGDGNLLFNVGPMPDGRIEPRQVERLKEMGRWLAKYGQTIYGTRGGPFKPGTWGASTYRGKVVYLHVLKWPEDGLELPPIARRIRSAQVLTGGAAAWRQSAEGISVNVGKSRRDALDTVIQLRLDGAAADIVPVAVLSGNSFARGKLATASNVFARQDQFGAAAAFDGDPETRWATDAGTKTAWLEVDLGKPETFSSVTIDEWAPGGRRVQSFELQAFEGGKWKTFYRGTTLGPNWEKKVSPVTAQRVRLNILDATEGPTLNEFGLLP